MKVDFAFQCGVQWDDMDGGERVRHCQSCDHAVYDLSQMTRSEARQFLERADGHLCVSFLQDEEGELVTKPERPKRGVLGKLSAAALTLPLLLAGCDRAETDTMAVAQPTAPTEPTAPTPPTAPVEVPDEALSAIGAAVRTASDSAEADCDGTEKDAVTHTTPPKPEHRRLAGKPRMPKHDSRYPSPE